MYMFEGYISIGVCVMILLVIFLLISYISRENLTDVYIGHLHWTLIILYTCFLFLIYRIYGQNGMITSNITYGFIIIWSDLTLVYLYYCCKMEYIVKRRISRIHKMMAEIVDNLHHYAQLIRNPKKYGITEKEIIDLRSKCTDLRNDYSELKEILKKGGIKRSMRFYN